MNYRDRLPTINSSLQTLASFGLKIDTVVDVGVLMGTNFLIQEFPNALHHLIEPIDSHDKTIAANYRSVRHQLDHVAMSSEPGFAFQVGICRDGSGATTHSFISDKESPIGSEHGGARVTECRRVKKTTLDAHFLEKGGLAAPYLVKIDVDGHELPIIMGGQKVLAGADIVIIEATVATLIERGAAISALGFQLIDVVDLCYYHNTLSQVDLIFASHRLLKQLPDLKPWDSKQFSYEYWFVLSSSLSKPAADPGKA